MELKKYEIALRQSDGRQTSATVAHDVTRADKRLFLEFDGEKYSSEEVDYFQAFCSIRHQYLEKRNIVPLCYAASVDVWPSAMSSDMGAGLKAYKSKIGVPGGKMVDIFSTGEDISPATVKEQRVFHKAWFESLASEQAPITRTRSPARTGFLGWLARCLGRSGTR